MLQHRRDSDEVKYPLGKVNTPYFITNKAVTNISKIFVTIINFIIKENLLKENFVLCENIFESFEYILLNMKVFLLNEFSKHKNLFYYNELLSFFKKSKLKNKVNLRCMPKSIPILHSSTTRYR